ncbi:pyridoxamine 5'-phosphate oxidase [Bacteroidia bacterium]|nr:pyridoxamine 5'-phosphate oxidase [Bacteroidia bacterium]
MKDLRKNYTAGELVEYNLPSSPFELFTQWFEDASNSDGIVEPNAMVLSTVNSDLEPDSRIVLLKDIRKEAFVFYTNYDSNKGQQIAHNGNCTLLFPWVNLERQVIIRGFASRVSEQESIDYFNSRPKSSRIGAWASSQSNPIHSREDLEKQLKMVEAKYTGTDIPKPPHWGGFALDPREIEFWQGRPNRLHDRLVYRKNVGHWNTVRLQP